MEYDHFFTRTGKAYAKFVNEKVLSIKGQISANTTAESASTHLRVVTTVDNLNYKEVGFKITFNGRTVKVGSSTVYTKILSEVGGVAFPYEPTIFCEQSGYFMTYTITDIPNAAFDSDFVITPYWITLDGSECSGVTNTLRVTMGF